MAFLAVVVVLGAVCARVAAEGAGEEAEDGGRGKLAAAARVACEEEADGACKGAGVCAWPRGAHALVAERRHGAREQAPARGRARTAAHEVPCAVVAPHGMCCTFICAPHSRHAVHGARCGAAHGAHEAREARAEGCSGVRWW